MKLIKLDTDHYIIVDDSEIKEGDWCYDKVLNIVFQTDEYTDFKYINQTDNVLKITHSNIGHLYQDSILPLSLQEVKELIGEVDVEKMAYNTAFKFIGTNDEQVQYLKSLILEFYTQALEDNKDRKYTEDDVRKAIIITRQRVQIVGSIDVEGVIQSLQPKTEWEVEIVDGKLKLKLFH